MGSANSYIRNSLDPQSVKNDNDRVARHLSLRGADPETGAAFNSNLAPGFASAGFLWL